MKGQGKNGIPSQLPLGHLPAETVASFTVPFHAIEDAERGLRQTLDRFGCAVVLDVAPHEDLQRLESLFAADMQDLVNQDASGGGQDLLQQAMSAVAADPRAWPKKSLPALGQLDRCQLRGLPHGRFPWACRLLPSVRRCYEVIHGSTRLISSCDNSFFCPGSAEEQRTNRVWPHVDHNANDTRVYDEDGLPMKDWDVYQGVLYVWPAEDSKASTTVVLPGSHKEEYELLMADPAMVGHGQRGGHFCQLSRVANEDLRTDLFARWATQSGRVPLPAGALFLWNSRTLHQGWSGGPRLAQPVCWEPVQRRDALAYDRKLRLAALGLPSTHWASLGTPHTLVKPVPCQPSAASVEGETVDDVALPVNAFISLASLKTGHSVEEMWRHLQDCSWEAPLAPELRQLLLDAISDEVLAAL